MPETLPDPETIRRTAREVLANPEYQLEPRPERPDENPIWERFQAWLGDWREWIESLLPEAGDWRRPAVLLAAGVIAAMTAYLVFDLWRRRTRTIPLIQAEPEAAELPPDELERRANEAGSRKEYAAAVRMLLRASVLRLEAAERRINPPGVTNRELLRRYRSTPLHEPFARLVDAVDVAWYGGRDCTALDFRQCREASAALRALAARGSASQA